MGGVVVYALAGFAQAKNPIEIKVGQCYKLPLNIVLRPSEKLADLEPKGKQWVLNVNAPFKVEKIIYADNQPWYKVRFHSSQTNRPSPLKWDSRWIFGPTLLTAQRSNVHEFRSKVTPPKSGEKLLKKGYYVLDISIQIRTKDSAHGGAKPGKSLYLKKDSIMFISETVSWDGKPVYLIEVAAEHTKGAWAKGGYLQGGVFAEDVRKGKIRKATEKEIKEFGKHKK